MLTEIPSTSNPAIDEFRIPRSLAKHLFGVCFSDGKDVLPQRHFSFPRAAYFLIGTWAVPSVRSVPGPSPLRAG